MQKVLSNNLKKDDIIKYLSRTKGYSKNFSKKLITDLIIILRKEISNGNLILKNFGVFKLIMKKERIGRNPKTKEEFLIKARKSISFKVSKKFINLLNV